jgi:hypothetical protein
MQGMELPLSTKIIALTFCAVTFFVLAAWPHPLHWLVSLGSYLKRLALGGGKDVSDGTKAAKSKLSRAA